MKRLDPTQLYHACDLEQLTFDSTADIENLSEIIGQKRVLESIKFGIGMPYEGYNLYVMGSPGLGRHTVVDQELQSKAESEPTPVDWCYVANFDHPHTPRALQLPSGIGRKLQHDMEQLIDDLLNAIPAAFQSDEFGARSLEISTKFKQEEDEAATALNQRAADKGVALLHTPKGYTLAPSKDGNILDHNAFKKLSEEEQEKIEANLDDIREELNKAMSRMPIWQREIHKSYKALERQVIEATVAQMINELLQSYQPIPAVIDYLNAVHHDIVEHGEIFREAEGEEGKKRTSQNPEFSRYRINTLVDNDEVTGAPIIYEDSPTYQNLIGRVEHIAHFGTLMTDFTMIKAGALHRANGGYLILDAERILNTPYAWEGLKRALRAEEVRIESIERLMSLVTTISLEPQPIPINLKVLIIGSRQLYYMLKEYDPEFSLLFKVTADFSETMSREDHNDKLYAQLIATLQKREGLQTIDRTGVGRIIEESVRRAGHGNKLSLHLGSLSDLLRESDFCAKARSSKVTQTEDVQTAIAAQERRVSQYQEQMFEEILAGTLLISTEGTQLAQVNALMVIQLGDFAFGVPARVSATARLGAGEVIDIEREVAQAGTIHSKGVMILSSYLASRYAKHQPLSVSASLVFEQTYGSIEGDSASVAELCALLSALGDIPIKQSLAITGSINQHGQVQAIGGVCEKIEGFFDVCQKRGLTGNEGVIIPEANMKELMLRHRVIEAVERGEFHIYAVSHVEQAMELLTGQAAGLPNADGLYPESTINGHIQLRLAEWTMMRLHYSNPPADELGSSD
ncbi:MAG: AAA family ATPase [Candidatus Polarisedimenticolaceae bacterium]|nr:AAA family ATPase [Candidatus Polarisedimenticolaceae bacterium]